MVAEPPSDRQALRRAMRTARRSLSPGVASANASAVADRAVDLLTRSGLPDDAVSLIVGATIADDGELDPGPLVEALVARGARVAYARVVDGTMGFALVGPPGRLVVGPGGVRQPAANAVAIPAQDLDVVLVPVVAFDARCDRIGRGAGHYDRTFADRGASSPLLIGLAHDEQRVADVVPEAHDVALDHIVTPTAVFSRRHC
ncbi:MAG: 5-formyltetrahydrofolate cyclo-ligase [Acidimicrobiales bacterium]